MRNNGREGEGDLGGGEEALGRIVGGGVEGEVGAGHGDCLAQEGREGGGGGEARVEVRRVRALSLALLGSRQRGQTGLCRAMMFVNGWLGWLAGAGRRGDGVAQKRGHTRAELGMLEKLLLHAGGCRMRGR